MTGEHHDETGYPASINGSNTLTGTDGSDVLIQLEEIASGTDIIHAGDGDDVVIGDSAAVQTTATLEAGQDPQDPSLWTTAPSSLLADDTVATTTFLLDYTGTDPIDDIFSQVIILEIPDGETLTVDADFGGGIFSDLALGIEPFAFQIEGLLLDSLLTNADEFGGGGSSSGDDYFIQWTNDLGSDQVVLIIADIDADVVPPASMYLSVSLTGQAATASDVQDDDIIHGEGGNDYLFGMGGNDILYGGADDDILVGGAGADQMYGGAGTGDIVSYEGSAANVVVSLQDGRAIGGDGTGDTFEGVEGAFGSAGNDVMTGFVGVADRLEGRAGSDSFFYTGGQDVILGGLGLFDRIEINAAVTAGSVFDGGTELPFVPLSLDGLTVLPDEPVIAVPEVPRTPAVEIDTLVLREFGGGAAVDFRDAQVMGFEILRLREEDGGAAAAYFNDSQFTFNEINWENGVTDDTLIEVDLQQTKVDFSHIVFDGYDATRDAIQLIDTLGTTEWVRGTQGNDLISTVTATGIVMEGGLGDDSLSAAAGAIAHASYANASGAVTVNLGTGVATGADGTDSLNGIYGVIGSAQGDDLRAAVDRAAMLVGGDGGDRLEGGDLDDILIGGLGDDEMIGGAGTDVAIVADFEGLSFNGDFDLFDTTGLTVTLGVVSGTLIGTEGTDTLDGIEVIQLANTGSSSFIVLQGMSVDAATMVAEDGDDIYIAQQDQTYEVVEGNILPVALDDPDETTDEDTPVTLAGLLDNDSDLNGDPLSILSVDGSGTTGSVSLTADGTVIYDPNGQFEGLAPGQTDTDSFTYTITDGNGGIATATVTMAIDGVNDAPVAQDDAFSVDEDASIAGNLLDDNGNGMDSDPEDDDLSVALLSGPAFGVLDLQDDGSFSFNADDAAFDISPNAVEVVTFTYQLSDDGGLTDTGTVTLNVQILDDGEIVEGGNGKDILVGTDGGEDQIFGGNGKDQLYGLDGADEIFGGNGEDELFGGDSIDDLFGGNGDDLLDGGAGPDVLTGGRGADIFLLAAGDGPDEITDFELSNDQIALSDGLTPGDLTLSTDGIDTMILAGTEVLAIVRGVDSTDLGDFI